MIIVEFYQQHPAITWLIAAALILVAELATGSGWLLWPAVCAGVVAAITFVAPNLGLPAETATFAVLTILTSLTARRYLPARKAQPGDDINDRAHHLVGKTGQVTGAEPGHLRVLVDGAEWEAEGDDLTLGAGVRVTKVLGGARVRVEPA